MDRVDVIIACRNEVPANLERTCRGVLETAGIDVDVCVVHDGGPPVQYRLPAEVVQVRPGSDSRGCGQARHFGITHSMSAAEVVVLIDGHMDFPAGWAREIVDHLAANPTHVTCCHMQSMSETWASIAGQYYRGAFMARKSLEDGRQHWALCAKWNRAGTPDFGQIGAPMGACYGMRRDWYAAMGEPLGLLEAWGGDEELLAMCAFLCGGAVWLLPIAARHMYAAPHPGRRMTAREEVNIWGNRLAILRALPGGQLGDLEAWLKRTPQDWPAIEKSMTDRRERIDALRAVLAKGQRTLADMEAAGLMRDLTAIEVVAEAERSKARTVADRHRNRPAAPVATTMAPAPEPAPEPVAPAMPVEPEARPIVIRARASCPGCGRPGTLRQVEGMRPHNGFRQALSRCNRCGAMAYVREVY